MSYKMPTVCPCCATPLVQDGANLFCPNENGCVDQIRQRLQHAVSKGALDWDGFGPAQVDAVMALGCRQFSDLLALSAASLDPLFGPSQKAKFLQQREVIKTRPLWRKLVALGIEGVGQTMSKSLCAHYTALGGMIDAWIPGLRQIMGPVAVDNFTKFITSHVDELDRCEQYGYKFSESAPVASSGVLSGKTFCITGTMMSGTRPEVAATIEKYGGTCKGSVGKNLTYLVVGEGGGAGKANAAKKWGTQCITEEQLYALIGIPMPQITAAAVDEF